MFSTLFSAYIPHGLLLNIPTAKRPRPGYRRWHPMRDPLCIYLSDEKMGLDANSTWLGAAPRAVASSSFSISLASAGAENQ
jgi:hypothetical protein